MCGLPCRLERVRFVVRERPRKCERAEVVAVVWVVEALVQGVGGVPRRGEEENGEGGEGEAEPPSTTDKG